MKTGLILEGGAMRGLFTAGVMDVLLEAGIKFDGIIGVSAGAAFGCNYKSGQSGRVLRYNTRFCQDPRYCGLRCLLKTGDLFSRDFCYGQVPLSLDPFDFAAYAADPTPFYVVCTDVHSGRPVYHQYMGFADHGFDWIRASASMPLVSQLVEIDGQQLLDGGISDSIPLAYFKSIGYTRNVAVLTQPAGYHKKKSRILPLIRLKYRKYPNLTAAMEKRHRMYNQELAAVAQEESSGHLFVIRPESALPVRRMERDPAKLRLAYAAGRKEAQQRLPALLHFLTASPE